MEILQSMSEELSSELEPESDISHVLINDLSLKKNFHRKKKQYKKPMELTELEHRTSILNKKRRTPVSNSKEVIDILPFIDQDLDNIYKTTWNKLEKGQRLNRINLFIEELNKKGLTELKCKRLKCILHNHICNGKINKNTDVDYNEETCLIVDIKGLNIIDNSFKFTLEKSKKTKSSNKSKSNIDRFMRS